MDRNPLKFRLSKLENENFQFEYDNEKAKMLYIQILFYKFGEKEPVQTYDSHEKMLPLKFRCKPGTSYTLVVTYADSKEGPILGTWTKCIATNPEGYEFMSKEVLHARMIRASNFYHGKYATIEALNCKEPNVFDANNPNAVSVKFHRASDAAYWRKVKENGAIETEIRTGSQGHPSRVNHSFGGIYLFAREYICLSFFGDQNVKLTPNVVLGDKPTDEFSFFYGDTKCYAENATGNRPVFEWQANHYILIAIARKQTGEEKYCDEHLIKLFPDANPFFAIQQNANGWEFMVYKGNHVWIEIFLMERLVLDPDRRRLSSL